MTAGSLAGCLGTGGDSGETDDPGEAESVAGVIADGVVDYEALTDGDGAIGDDPTSIAYASPSQRFLVETLLGGGTPTGGSYRVSPDLGGDDPTIFFAPEYLGDEWRLHVFANEAFLGADDWRVIDTDADGVAGEYDASFAAVVEGISHVSVTVSGAADAVAIANRDPEGIRAEDVDATAFLLVWAGSGTETEVPGPQAAFSFDFREDAVTITHDGGEVLDTENLSVVIEGSTVGGVFSGGEFRTGDSVEVDLSSYSGGDELRIVWSDGEQSRTLARTDIP